MSGIITISIVRIAIAEIGTTVVIVISPSEVSAISAGVGTRSGAVYWIVETHSCQVISPGAIRTVKYTSASSVVGKGLTVLTVSYGTIGHTGASIIFTKVGIGTDCNT